MEKRKYLKKFSDTEIIESVKISTSYQSALESIGLKKSTCHKYLKKFIAENKINIDHFEKKGKRKYSFDENFFDNIDNFEKAYWLGFIMADGGLIKIKNSYCLVIRLGMKDINHLKLFKKSLKSTHPINVYNNQPQISLCSKKLGEDLIKYGIIPNKTHEGYRIPMLKKHVCNHFILGYFDGDGCVYSNKNTIGINFVGCKTFLEELHRILSEVSENNVKIKNYKNHSLLAYGGNVQVKKIYDYLYNNSEFCLERKKHIYEKFYTNWEPIQLSYGENLLRDLVPVCSSINNLCYALGYKGTNTKIYNKVKNDLEKYKIDYSNFKNNSSKLKNDELIQQIKTKHNYKF